MPTMTRRGFLGAILAAAVAPAIVRADSLMRIVPRDALVFHPDAFVFSSDELVLTQEDFRARVLAPLMRFVVAGIDTSGIRLAQAGAVSGGIYPHIPATGIDASGMRVGDTFTIEGVHATQA